MKRIGNLYEKIYDMDNLKEAHKNARRGKGWYKEVKQVDKYTIHYLRKLQRMLIDKTYKTSDYVMFMKKEGNKVRKIYKLPYFPDRIAQWAIIQAIEPYLIKNFVSSTYSAIPGRGAHMCLKKIQKDIRRNPKGCQYCLKIDVKHYYQTINHELLKQKYERLFKDKDLLWLIGEIIDSIDTIDKEDIERMHNENIGTNGGVGIPIGNYLSQYSGNLYLSQFDHWMKEEQKIKYYRRYMDDIIVLGESKKELRRLFMKIKKYLKHELNLLLKTNYQIFPTYIRGIDFIGYRIFSDYVLLRKTTCKTMKKRIKKIKDKCMRGQYMTLSDWCSLNSYKGILKYCNGHRLYKKYIYPLEEYMKKLYKICIKGDINEICLVLSIV